MENQDHLSEDHEDLLQVLLMRFGYVPEPIMQKITAITDPDLLNRLILVAANAESLSTFEPELAEDEPFFRIPSAGFEMRSPEDPGHATN